jgi:hypothetical protein
MSVTLHPNERLIDRMLGLADQIFPRSFRFGRTSAPSMPHLVLTMRGSNNGA